MIDKELYNIISSKYGLPTIKEILIEDFNEGKYLVVFENGEKLEINQGRSVSDEEYIKQQPFPMIPYTDRKIREMYK